MRVRAFAAAAAAAVISVPFGAAAAQAGGGPDNSVEVLHLVPLPVAATVDVLVDDAPVPALADLEFLDSRNVTLPDGDYNIKIIADDDPGTVLIEADATVTTDGSIVAHLNADANPVITPFEDDLTPTEPGQARVTVRHTAQAEPVDIAVEGLPGSATIANQQELGPVEVPEGEYDVTTSQGGAVIDELSVEDYLLEAGRAYIIYAFTDRDPTLPPAPEAPEYFLSIADFVADVGVTDDDDDDNGAATPTPVIPTAVPAGDGTAGWTGPLALPALVALALGGVLALAVAMAVRGSAVRR